MIWPPCSSMIFEQMARPRPTPSGFVVKKGLKMLSRFLVDTRAAVDDGYFYLLSSSSCVLIVTTPPGGTGLGGVQDQVGEDAF